MDVQPVRFTVQPTAMRPGCVAGKPTVPSLTPYEKPMFVPSGQVTPFDESHRSAVPSPSKVIAYVPLGQPDPDVSFASQTTTAPFDPDGIGAPGIWVAV